MQQFEIDGFVCVRELGSGATGKVYIGQKEGKSYAIKILERDGNPEYQRLHENMIVEVNALSQVKNHPYIMEIVGHGIDISWVQHGVQKHGDYIATEVVPNGELFDYVDNPMGPISEPVAKQLFLQMLAALTFLHQGGLVNRDLKLENMLVGDDFNIRMADFGFAQALEGRHADGENHTFLGTPGYMAPEIMEGRPYRGAAVDTYALGVVLFALVTASTPFQAIQRVSNGETVFAVDRLYQLFCLDKDKFYGRYQSAPLSAEFRGLMDAMLNPNPLLRPSAADMLMHPWVTEQSVTADMAREEMRARKAAKDGQERPVPSLTKRRSARQALRGGGDGDKTYVVGPLTEEQQAAGDVVALRLNTHVRGENIPGSRLVYAAIAAPDLFSWLQTVIKSREAIDDLSVDDNVWKITYKISRTIDPPEMDDDIREFFDESHNQNTTIDAEVTAEILQIQDDEEQNVVEFRRKNGDPSLYNEHISHIVDEMQQEQDHQQQAAATNE